jgi:hypothetical protein
LFVSMDANEKKDCKMTRSVKNFSTSSIFFSILEFFHIFY